MIELRRVKNLMVHIFCVNDPINPGKGSQEEKTRLARTSAGLDINAVVIKCVFPSKTSVLSKCEICS